MIYKWILSVDELIINLLKNGFIYKLNLLIN